MKALTRLVLVTLLLPATTPAQGSTAAGKAAPTDPAREFRQIRDALAGAPRERELQNAFLAAWTRFETQGLFTCGTPIETTLSKLGKPDQKTARTGVSTYRYGHMSVYARAGKVHAIVNLLGMTKGRAPTYERLEWKPGGDAAWTVGYRLVERRRTLLQYVTGDETLPTATRIVTHVHHPGLRARVSVGEFVALGERAFLQLAKKQGAKGRWTVLHEDEDRCVYEFVVQGGRSGVGERELSVLVAGPTDLHRVAYRTRGTRSSPDRAAWIERFKTARVVLTDAGKKRRARTRATAKPKPTGR